MNSEIEEFLFEGELINKGKNGVLYAGGNKTDNDAQIRLKYKGKPLTIDASNLIEIKIPFWLATGTLDILAQGFNVTRTTKTQNTTHSLMPVESFELNESEPIEIQLDVTLQDTYVIDHPFPILISLTILSKRIEISILTHIKSVPGAAPREKPLRISWLGPGEHKIEVTEPGSFKIPNSLKLCLDFNPARAILGDLFQPPEPFFRLWFEIPSDKQSPIKPEDLTTLKLIEEIRFSLTPEESRPWELTETPDKELFVWNLKYDGKWEMGISVLLDIKQIFTELPPGSSFFYVHYSNLPGYSDGLLNSLIEKTDANPRLHLFQAVVSPLGECKSPDPNAKYGETTTGIKIRVGDSICLSWITSGKDMMVSLYSETEGESAVLVKRGAGKLDHFTVRPSIPKVTPAAPIGYKLSMVVQGKPAVESLPIVVEFKDLETEFKIVGPEYIYPGGSTNLHYKVTSATAFEIDQGCRLRTELVPVAEETITVRPAKTTTYTLIAEGFKNNKRIAEPVRNSIRVSVMPHLMWGSVLVSSKGKIVRYDKAWKEVETIALTDAPVDFYADPAGLIYAFPGSPEIYKTQNHKTVLISKPNTKMQSFCLEKIEFNLPPSFNGPEALVLILLLSSLGTVIKNLPPEMGSSPDAYFGFIDVYGRLWVYLWGAMVMSETTLPGFHSESQVRLVKDKKQHLYYYNGKDGIHSTGLKKPLSNLVVETLDLYTPADPKGKIIFYYVLKGKLYSATFEKGKPAKELCPASVASASAFRVDPKDNTVYWIERNENSWALIRYVPALQTRYAVFEKQGALGGAVTLKLAFQ